MSKPEQEVLNSAGGKGGKRAVSVRYGPDGSVEILAIAEGKEAEALVAQAADEGIEVRESVEEVDELFQSGQPSTRVPPEVYELMSVIVEFAQELDEAWVTRE